MKKLMQPTVFYREFSRIVDWAVENRSSIQSAIEVELGPLEVILDLPHNTFEPLPEGGAIIRKGAVYVEPGDLNIIPSNMTGNEINGIRGVAHDHSHLQNSH